MNDDFQRGILLLVAILIVISFTLGLESTNKEIAEEPVNPLIIFNS